MSPSIPQRGLSPLEISRYGLISCLVPPSTFLLGILPFVEVRCAQFVSELASRNRETSDQVHSRPGIDFVCVYGDSAVVVMRLLRLRQGMCSSKGNDDRRDRQIPQILRGWACVSQATKSRDLTGPGVASTKRPNIDTSYCRTK